MVTAFTEKIRQLALRFHLCGSCPGKTAVFLSVCLIYLCVLLRLIRCARSRYHMIADSASRNCGSQNPGKYSVKFFGMFSQEFVYPRYFHCFILSLPAFHPLSCFTVRIASLSKG